MNEKNHHITEPIEGSRMNTLCKFEAYSIVDERRAFAPAGERISSKQTNNNLSAFFILFDEELNLAV